MTSKSINLIKFRQMIKLVLTHDQIGSTLLLHQNFKHDQNESQMRSLHA